MQPSVSTQNMAMCLPEASAVCTAFAVPSPTPPATGKMISAPSVMNVLPMFRPSVVLVKFPAKVPFCDG